MKQLVSLEVYHVVKELQDLAGAKVSKAFQPDKTEIILELHKTGIGRKLVRIMPGLAVYLTTKKRKNPEAQLGFSKLLRKRLTNARLESIMQKNFERIVEMKFAALDGTYCLIAEFLPHGTLIFCDSNYKIISALEYQKWKDRRILPNLTYEYPPSKSLSPLDLSQQDLFKAISEMHQESLVKFLAIKLSLGGKYAEYLCNKANLDKNAKSFSGKEIYLLHKELNDILSAASPLVSEDDVFLFNGNLKSFNEALDIYYGKYIENEELELQESYYSKKLSTLKSILESQKEQLVLAEASVIEGKQKGDLVYANYSKIKEVIGAIKLARSKKIGWAEIAEKLKAAGIDVKDGSFSIGLE